LPNYSTFTEDQNWVIDQFRYVFNLPATQYANAILLNQLKALTNPTSDQIAQINSLTIALQDYNVSPDQFNAFSQALMNMEQLIKNVVNFQDKELWSGATSYDMFNTVQYNNQTYMSKKNINLNHIPVGGVGDDWFSLIAKKGASFRPLGLWSNVTSYVNNIDYIDVVYSNGSTFYCIQSHTNQQPSQAYPPIDTAYWGILSRIGATGTTGATGENGLNLLYQQAYNSGTSYSVADAVSFNNSIYYCINPTIGGIDPTDLGYWALFLSSSAIPISASAPLGPSANQLWVNSTTKIISYWNSGTSTWIPLTASAITDGTYTFTASDINTMQTNITNNSNQIVDLLGGSAISMTSTQDASSRTTNITYTRSDSSTYKTIDYSNFNSNDKPQTIVTKLYSSTSVLETTNTATLVWSTDGSYVVSSSEVIS